MEVNFFVPGKPQGKGRPRFSRASGTVYTPQKTTDYENLVRECYILAGGRKFDTPVKAYMKFLFEIPKSWSKAKRKEVLAGKIKPGKPDLDNEMKIIMDGLNGVAYKDDSQVYWGCIEKAFILDDSEPGVLVTLVGEI